MQALFDESLFVEIRLYFSAWRRNLFLLAEANARQLFCWRMMSSAVGI